MSGPISSLYTKVGADIKDFQSGMKTVKNEMRQTETDVKRAQSTFKSLNDTVKMVAAGMTAYGVISAGKYFLELDKLGRESLRLKESFKQLAEANQGSSQQILNSLKEASQGAISETDIILGANKAMSLGLGANAETLGRLMEVAAFKARNMGITTTQAWNDIVTGIGRKSPLILDNLGIVGLTMDKTATKADIMAEVIESGMRDIAAAGGMATDAAGDLEKMNAQLDNMKTRLGELAVKSGAVDVGVNFVTEGATGWVNTFDAMDTIDAWAAEHHKSTLEVTIVGALNVGAEGISGRLNEMAQNLTNTLNYYGDRIFDPQRAAATELLTKQKELNQATGLALQQTGNYASAIDEVNAAIRRAPSTYGADDYSNAYQFSDEAVTEAKAFMIRADQEIAEKRQKESEKYWKDYQAKAEESASRIKSLISGAFTSVSDDIRGALQGTSADPGEAWDEMARRAEAVANDVAKTGTSPWLAMFDIPQDILEKGGETLKAYMQMVADDIRNSPTVQELGTVGIDAMVKNIKKSMMDELGKQELENTVALQLATDPEAVALMEQLGIDVGAAVTSLQDPIVTSIDELKTSTLSTDVLNFPDLLTEDKASSLLESVKNEVNSLGDKTLAVEISNIGDLSLRNLMAFADGGIVPGPIGAPQAAIVHGGERVIPYTQNYYMTVNTRAERSTVVQDFNIMRSVAGSR